MGMDFGTAMIMLIRWLGSVALIIAVIVAVTLIADQLREGARTRTRD